MITVSTATKVSTITYREKGKPPTEMRGYSTFALIEGCAVFRWDPKEEVIIPLIQIAEIVSVIEEE